MPKSKDKPTEMESKTAENADFNLEQSLEKLEEIVSSLEDGELPLEQALQQFEQGVSLSRDCQAALSDAQQKIQELVDGAGGVELKALDDNP